MAKQDKLRTVNFSPYRKGMGPTFTLETWDAGERGVRDARRRNYLRYRLTEISPKTSDGIAHRRVVFEGDDFGCSPMHAIDSDDAIAALMGFLTLRPGDTDDELFANYTPAQRGFAENHAEALAAEVDARFGEGERGSRVETVFEYHRRRSQEIIDRMPAAIAGVFEMHRKR